MNEPLNTVISSDRLKPDTKRLEIDTVTGNKKVKRGGKGKYIPHRGPLVSHVPHSSVCSFICVFKQGKHLKYPVSKSINRFKITPVFHTNDH